MISLSLLFSSGTSMGSFAQVSARSIIAEITGFNFSWPKLTASSIRDSVSSLASDSTIKTPSFVPATTKSRSDFFISSIVGLITRLSSIIPILTAPIGPINGAPEIVKAADAPIIETISGSFSIS